MVLTYQDNNAQTPHTHTHQNTTKPKNPGEKGAGIKGGSVQY